MAITVRGDAKNKRLSPVVEERKCLHLYHYYEHPVFGRCHLRLQSWYPFTVDVCLNGRAWLARQMDAEGLAYGRADNCFVALKDPVRPKPWPMRNCRPTGPGCSKNYSSRLIHFMARFSPRCPPFAITGRLPKASTPPT